MERLFEESEQDVGATRRLRNFLRDFSRKEVSFAAALSAGECPAEPT
jgi:hypothetical protein